MLHDIPPTALLVTFIGLSAIIAIRYAMISGLFYWLLWGRPVERVGAIKLMHGHPAPGAVGREIRWSLAATAAAHHKATAPRPSSSGMTACDEPLTSAA